LRVAAAAGSDQGRRSGSSDAEQAQSAQRFAPGQQAVDVVGGDLFGDIALQRRHQSHYAGVCDAVHRLTVDNWQILFTDVVDTHG